MTDEQLAEIRTALDNHDEPFIGPWSLATANAALKRVKEEARWRTYCAALLADCAEKDKRIAELETVNKNLEYRLSLKKYALRNKELVIHERNNEIRNKRIVINSWAEKNKNLEADCVGKSAEITQLTAELAEANQKLELMPALEEALAECVSGLNDIAYVGDPRTTKMANATLLNIRPSREAIAAIDREREEKP